MHGLSLEGVAERTPLGGGFLPSLVFHLTILCCVPFALRVGPNPMALIPDIGTEHGGGLSQNLGEEPEVPAEGSGTATSRLFCWDWESKITHSPSPPPPPLSPRTPLQ